MALQNDPFASFAPVTQQVSRPTQPTKPVPETPTRAPKSQRSLIDGLELDVSGSEIRDDINENAVVDLLSRHDGILVQSKRTSKIWDRTFLVLRQLLDGSILDVNQVDSRWYASVSKRYPLVVPKYRDFNQMLVHLEDVNQYLELLITRLILEVYQKILINLMPALKAVRVVMVKEAIITMNAFLIAQFLLD